MRGANWVGGGNSPNRQKPLPAPPEFLIMKKIICYLRTIKEFKIFFMSLFNFGALYVAHNYIQQKSYIKGTKIFDPLKCETCGHVSEAWRDFK